MAAFFEEDEGVPSTTPVDFKLHLEPNVGNKRPDFEQDNEEQILLITKEERIKYKQFLQTKQKCIKLLNQYNNNEINKWFRSHLNKILLLCKNIANQSKSEIELLLNKFDKIQQSCNDEWSVNENDIQHDDNNCTNCINIMNDCMDEFKTFKFNIYQWKQNLNQYFEHLKENLEQKLNNVKNDNYKTVSKNKV